MKIKVKVKSSTKKSFSIKGLSELDMDVLRVVLEDADEDGTADQLTTRVGQIQESLDNMYNAVCRADYEAN